MTATPSDLDERIDRLRAAAKAAKDRWHMDIDYIKTAHPDLILWLLDERARLRITLGYVEVDEDATDYLKGLATKALEYPA
jgi:Uri superfamily endonuclease